MIANENILVNKRIKDDERQAQGDKAASPASKLAQKRIKTESSHQSLLCFGPDGGFVLPAVTNAKENVKAVKSEEVCVRDKQEDIEPPEDVVRLIPEGGSKDLEADDFSPDLLSDEDWSWFTMSGKERKYTRDKSL